MMPSIFRPLWAGCSKLPSTVAYFAGEVRNNPVDLGDGATLVAVLEAKTASTEIATDTQISGGLWAVATGFEFRDGSGHVAECDLTWEAGDTIGATIQTEGNAMRAGRTV